MAKNVNIKTFVENSDGSFSASGTLDGRAFQASTIVYRSEPIFKVREANSDGEVSNQRLDASQFTRGDRIALARALKARRLGTDQKSSGPSREDLEASSVKELRALCKERGISGAHDKGVTKADLIEKLAA